MEMPIYSYRRLDKAKNEIRLLFCVRGTEVESETILLGIRHIPLHELPEYVALSYTWGSKTLLRSILVRDDLAEDKTLAITQNLSFALPQLIVFANGRFFWIDAICINQDDEEEKSWQVGLMHSIFQQSASVFIWLGPDYDEGARTLRRLDKTGQAVCSEPLLLAFETSYWTLTLHGMRWPMPMSIRGAKPLELLLEEHDMSDSADADIPYHLTQKLLQRPWWRRTWVLQEIVLPGMECTMDERNLRMNNIVFACGNARSCLYNLAPVLTLARLKESWSNGTLYRQGHGYTGLSFDQRAFLMLSARVWLGRIPLFWLLVSTSGNTNSYRRLLATDLRDRIYGMLGVASDVGTLNLSLDYTKSCRDVYTQVAAAMIREYSPAVCLRVIFPKKVVGLASWVPDWSAESKGYTFHGVHGEYEHGVDKLICDVEPPFQPWPDENKFRDSVCINESAGVLGLKGIVIGQVATLIPEAAWTDFLKTVPTFVERSGYLNNAQSYNHQESEILSEQDLDLKWAAGQILQHGRLIFFQNQADDLCACDTNEIIAQNVESRNNLATAAKLTPYMEVESMRSEDIMSMCQCIGVIHSELRKACRKTVLDPTTLENNIWRTLVADQWMDSDKGWFRPSRHVHAGILSYAISVGSPSEELSQLVSSARLERLHFLLSTSGMFEDGLSLEDVKFIATSPRDQIGLALVSEQAQVRAAVGRRLPDGSLRIAAYLKPIDELAYLLHELGTLKGEIFSNRENIKRRIGDQTLHYQAIAVAAHDEIGRAFEFSSKQFAQTAFQMRQYLMTASSLAIGRKLFATADGRPGLGPMHMQVGDVVAAWTGVESLIVMRSHAGGYTYVGEAYIHGGMDGELTRNLSPIDFKIL